MDVERTIEFILESQAKIVENQTRNDLQIARLGRQIDGIQKLVKIGMREFVKLGKAQVATQVQLKDTQVQLKELAAEQKKTEQSLRAFIDSMRKGGNGKSSNGR